MPHLLAIADACSGLLIDIKSLGSQAMVGSISSDLSGVILVSGGGKTRRRPKHQCKEGAGANTAHYHGLVQNYVLSKFGSMSCFLCDDNNGYDTVRTVFYFCVE